MGTAVLSTKIKDGALSVQQLDNGAPHREFRGVVRVQAVPRIT